MAWKNIPEKKVLATLKDGKDFKGAAAEKMTIYVDGAVPGGDGDVQGISMAIDPSTYVMTTQLKDSKGGDVGSPATVDLPLESMVVGGEYDDATKKVILTLKNGETVEFSVADLVAGLQSEITPQNPLSADLVAETSNKNFVTNEEKEDISSISGLADDVETLNGNVEGLQSGVSGLNGDVNNLAGDVSTLQGDVSALQSDLDTKQNVIDSSNKLSADLIAETNDNKVMTSAERTKLAGIAAGAEVNVQADWNQTNSSADDYIKNKPTIPSKVSDLTNDAGYQNASQVSSAIASAVGDITSFEYQVVQTLPQTGEKGVVYLVPNSGTTPNIYDEYIYVNNAFEKIGTTEMDLSNYYTKTQTDTLLSAKADQSTTYTKTEVDSALGNKADSSDVYTKTQVDTALGNKANSSDVYSKSEVNTALAGKQDTIDANHKLDADLIDNSTSDNKTYETGTGAPTTSTAGSEGELYVDKSTGTVYVCTNTTGGTYTWEVVSGGSGPTVVQTTGQSTTSVMSQKAVTDAIEAVDGVSITMTYTDPGEGSSLQANHFIAVYEI